MTYGFSAISRSGYTQIDETYANYALKSWGTTSSPQSISIASDELLMIRLAYGASIGVYESVTVDYRIYAPSYNVTPSTGYGMRVYNGSGTLVFDSGNQPLRIYYTITQREFGAAELTVASPSGNRLWFNYGVLYIVSNIDGSNITSSVTQNADNSLRFFYRVVSGAGWPYTSFDKAISTAGLNSYVFLVGG